MNTWSQKEEGLLNEDENWYKNLLKLNIRINSAILYFNHLVRDAKIDILFWGI